LKVESPEKGGTRVACCLPDGTVKSNKRKNALRSVCRQN
jgi:hypothetical protein